MTEGITEAPNFLNKRLQQSVTRFLLTTEELWAIRLTASSAVAAGMGKAAIVAGIRKAVVVGVDTDNTLGEAAFAVE